SFQSLRYDEMWTLIGAIALLSAAADLWSSRLRSRPSDGLYRFTAVATLAIVVLSVIHLDLAGSRVLDGEILGRAARLASDSFPPRLPSGGLLELLSAMLSTLQMSVLAMAIAAGLGVGAAFLAARTGGAGRRLVSSLVRGFLL